MLGVPKGLLQLPDSDSLLIDSVLETLTRAGLTNVVLVGRNVAYSALQLPFVEDSRLGSGPLSGLLGLAEAAEAKDVEFIYAIACDMPQISVGLLNRLKFEHPDADALVPMRTHREPLSARYRARSIIPLIHQLFSRGSSSLQHLLDALGPRCVELEMSEQECATLTDWDSPADLPRGVRFDGKPLNTDDP